MRVFISHSSDDKRFVRYLKQCLNLNGINTWFDEDQLLLGDSLEGKLRVSIEKSTHFLIVLSQSSVASRWVNQELDLAVSNLDNGIIEKIIPVKLMECDIPSSLEKLTYYNLSDAIRLPKNDIVEFLDDTYDRFFIKLVKTLRAPNSHITVEDKMNILNSIGKMKVNGNRTINSRKLQRAHMFLNQIERAIIDHHNSSENSDQRITIEQIGRYLKNQKVIFTKSNGNLRQIVYRTINEYDREIRKLLNNPTNDEKWIETRKLKTIENMNYH